MFSQSKFMHQPEICFMEGSMQHSLSRDPFATIDFPEGPNDITRKSRVQFSNV
jgi:hypothetical protein